MELLWEPLGIANYPSVAELSTAAPLQSSSAFLQLPPCLYSSIPLFPLFLYSIIPFIPLFPLFLLFPLLLYSIFPPWIVGHVVGKKPPGWSCLCIPGVFLGLFFFSCLTGCEIIAWL